MNKTMTKLCFLSLMTFGLAAACGGDPAETNKDTPSTDMGGGGGTTDMGGGTTDMGGTETDMGGGTETDMGGDPTDMGDDMGGVEETAQSCSDPNPPARCSADPTTFTDWAPASVVSKLRITGSAEAEAGEETLDGCCYDFTGDGELDNALGDLVKDLLPGLTMGDLDLASTNETLQGAIDDGSIALILEHQGVDPASGGPFAINFLLGQQDGDFTTPNADGGNQYKINPASFDQGVWPQARIGNASLDGTKVSGGPGVVALAFNLLGIDLNLRISAAQVEANVAMADTDGVKLIEGKLGGVLRINDLINALNSFASANCGCLGASGDFISGTNVEDGYECADFSASTCEDGVGEFGGICKQASDFCGVIVRTLPSIADVNSEAIGSECEVGVDCDAISVGFQFEAAGAVITGVGAAQ